MIHPFQYNILYNKMRRIFYLSKRKIFYEYLEVTEVTLQWSSICGVEIVNIYKFFFL
jgi:hypothetical protein